MEICFLTIAHNKHICNSVVWEIRDVQEKPVCISSMVDNGWNSVLCWTHWSQWGFFFGLLSKASSYLYLQITAMKHPTVGVLSAWQPCWCCFAQHGTAGSTCCSGERCSWNLPHLSEWYHSPHKGSPMSEGSLTQQLLNVTWRFLHAEGKSCFLQLPLQVLLHWSQSVIVPCSEQKGKKSLIWTKLPSMLLSVPKHPLL